MVDLDVDHPDPDPDLRVEVLDGLKVVVGSVGQFEDEVVGVEGVEEVEEVFPLAGLDGLPAVVAEAEMHGGGPVEGVQDPVDGFWMLKRSVADRKIAALAEGRDLYLGS